VRELPARLAAASIAPEVTDILTSSVHLDVERLRLSLDGGWPWETVRIEREFHRQSYGHSTLGYRLFHMFVLGTAGLLPPRSSTDCGVGIPRAGLPSAAACRKRHACPIPFRYEAT